MTYNKSYNAFRFFLISDAKRYYNLNEISRISIPFLILNAFICFHHCLAWSFWFRLCQSKTIFPLQFLAKVMKRHLSNKYGILIPSSTIIGPGLYLGHGIGIVINGKTKIGKNCNISQFLTIGSNKGTPATIGDNVYIGPGVCIVEDVKIGNNVKIGAGTVVIHDVPDNATTVGNPNRIILK